MIDPRDRSDEAISGAIDAAQAPQPGEAAQLPPALVDWLARIRLLWGVPFSYLVPHEQMLPAESVRFFYLNRNWLDAAVDGALSATGATTRDRAHLESLYPALRDAIDVAERQQWARLSGVPPVEGDAEVVTGMLMRSRAVSGYPGTEVRAYRAGENGEEQARVLRAERLGPSVLLMLFDGIPLRIEIEEPRGAVRFGVDTKQGQPAQRTVTPRDPQTGQTGADVTVPFRPGGSRVIDMASLRTRLAQYADNPAEFAFQLLQYPTRQTFEDVAPVHPVFRSTIDFDLVRQSAGGT